MRKKINKIGVFLPAGYKGGLLNEAKNIAKMLYLGSREKGEPVDVVLSCVDHFYNSQETFEDLLSLGILVRETCWKTINAEELSTALTYLNIKKNLDHKFYNVPVDGICNFMDCDFWLFVSDKINLPPAPLKPYGVVVYDYIQRYVSELLDDVTVQAYLPTVRNANFVLTTTPQTREDAIQFAGLKAGKVFLAPMEFDPLDIVFSKPNQERPYFLWSTNAAIHKNHLNTLKGILHYYESYEGRFDIVVTGYESDLFNPKVATDKDNFEHIQAFRNILAEKENVLERFTFKGNLSIRQYISYLANAAFLVHPVLIDNGTFCVVEAAYHGVPSLSHSYPQMHYINEKFNLNMHFMNAKNPLEIGKKLKYMEDTYEKMKITLPTKENLKQFSYHNTAKSYWELVRKLI